MKMNMRKLIMFVLVLVQAAGPVAAASMPGVTDDEQENIRISVQELGGISSIFFVIGSNLSEQAQRLVEFACLSTRLADYHDSPLVPCRQKKMQSVAATYTVAPTASATFRYEQVDKYCSWLDSTLRTTGDNVMCLSLLAVCIFFMDRRKLARHLCRLPRGSVEDAIINHYLGIEPSLVSGSMRVFLFPGGQFV